MFVYRRDVTIEWGDCDAAGIVFYPRYFAMFDASTAYLFTAALGYGTQEMRWRFGVIGFPMIETSARFHIASSFGDVVTIESQATRFGHSSFDIEHRLLKGNTLAIDCKETRVWAASDPADPTRMKSVDLPREVIDRLSNSN